VDAWIVPWPGGGMYTFVARFFMNNNKHYLAAIGAFTIWGTFSIALRAMAEFVPSTILYFRVLIAALILVLFFSFVKRKVLMENLGILRSFDVKKRARIGLFLVIGGLLLAINWLVFIHVVNHVSIKAASFSYFICPVLTAVLAYVFLKEKLSVVQWVSVAICAVSCLLIGRDSLKEAGFSLIVASSYAIYLIVMKQLGALDKLVVLLFQVGTALLIITPFYGYLVPHTPTDVYFYLGTAGIAFFFTVLPMNLQLFALQRLNSSTIGILMYINPMMNFLVGVLVFHEAISLFQGLGYVLILGAVVLFNYENIRRVLGRG